MTRKDGSSIVVSGAAGSLGSALCEFFLERGDYVTGLDRTVSMPPVDHTADQWASRQLDLTDETDTTAAFGEIVEARGRVDLLVNCTGLIWNEPSISLSRGRFVTHSLDSWKRVLDANLTAPFLASVCAARHMARQPDGGCIINFGSIAGQGNPGQVAYSAAKAGIVGLTKALARELGPVGVRVNAIAPGFIDVKSTTEALPQERLDEISTATPLRRLGTTEEVTGAVLFLWLNRFVTAAIVPVDGGYVL